MNGPTLTIHGGVGEIGGTRVIIRQERATVVLDMGLAYMPGQGLFEHPLTPRPERALVDYLNLGLAAPIDGIYDPRALAAAQPWEAVTLPAPYAPGTEAALFISHLHQDHIGLLPWIDPRLPVYLSPESARLLTALRRVAPELDQEREYGIIRPGEAVKVGPLRVQAWPVDHDIPGAQALAVQTAAGSVVYSGDLRLTGSHPERTQAFAQAARALRPLVLLLEGTRLNPPGGPAAVAPTAELNEPEIGPAVARALREEDGPAFVALYERNLERVATLIAAARQTGRQLMVEPELMQLLRAVPDLALLPPGWESQVAPFAVAAARAEPGRYLVQLSFPNLVLLPQLLREPGGLFIHSNGQPMGRFDPAFALLQRWLDRFGLRYLPLQASGHALPEHLQSLAATIAPEILMPIHSRFAEGLQEPEGGRRILPRNGETFHLEGVLHAGRFD